jgi:hypothetical protein
MNRRMFTAGISGSFIAGAVGGATAGAAGTARGLHALTGGTKQSYSQNGEDLLVACLMDYIQVKAPSYLDIGAADPIRINNTYLFYQMGWRGVLVEPNPACCRRLGSQRPRDTVLNAGIGISDRKQADYYMISGKGGEDLNTFSKDMAESYPAKTRGRHKIEKVIPMPLLPINQVFLEHFSDGLGFMSIDTEGLDMKILETLDFGRFRPSVVCVETLIFGTKGVASEILDFMSAKGYIARGGSFVNTIFVDGRLLR